MQDHETADPERRSYLLRKTSTSVLGASKGEEGITGSVPLSLNKARHRSQSACPRSLPTTSAQSQVTHRQ